MSYVAINATSIFKSYKTGVEFYAFQLLKHLALEWKEDDPKVILFVPQHLLNNKNQPLPLPSNWEIKPLEGKIFWTQIYLAKYLRKHPPLLLFSPSYMAPFFLSGIPTVNVIHGLEGKYVKQKSSFIKKIEEIFLIKPVLKKSAVIIAVSRHTKEDIAKFYNIPLSLIKVIQSGPGTLEKPNSQALQKSQEMLKCIAFAGNGNSRKNLRKAVKIFLWIKKITRGQAKLYISGRIKNTKLKELIDHNKNNIVYKKYFSEEEKNEYLKNSHFLLYLSAYEGFGFPVLEAQNFSAVPIVIKDSGLEEVGGEGIIFVDSTEKEEKIAKKIVNLYKNPEKLKQLQTLGLLNLQKFSWQRCAVETKKIMLESI